MMKKESNELGPAGWVALIAMLALLAAAIAYAAQIWTSVDASMSGLGWTFLVGGIVVTVALGAGLMALLFYSSRHDLDR